MSEWLNQEPFKQLAAAGVGGGIIVAIVRILMALIERRVPSLESEQQSEASFRKALLERVAALETDRDRLTRESVDYSNKYWELQGKYAMLETTYRALAASNCTLIEQHERLLAEYRKVRERLDALSQLQPETDTDKV